MLSESLSSPERLADRNRDVLAALYGAAKLAGLSSFDDPSTYAEEVDEASVSTPETLSRLGARYAEVCAGLFEAQQSRLARMRDELAQLRRLRSPEDVLAAAPAALCRACGFDRALASTVRGSVWSPVALHVTAEADSPVNIKLAKSVRDREISLMSWMPEAEVVRRKAPALVPRLQKELPLFRPLGEPTCTIDYVATPVQAGGAIIGLLHADRHSSPLPLTVADRDRLHSFADALGVIVERAVTLQRLRLQQERLEEAFSAVRKAVDGIATAPARPVPTAVAAVQPQLTGSDGLTPREREVMQLLTSGATNAEIASQLTVSETTVKSHVKHILRKLQASNRAEAIARYLYLTRGRACAS